MKVVKIQFKQVGKKYYFSPVNFELSENEPVIVETVRGIELGFVASEIFEIDESELVSDLKPIIRKATESDLKNYKQNKEQEAYVIAKTKELSKNNDLEMKVLGGEYTIDRSKLIIYFETEGRVDFRQLVKDLADEFHVRIELRQVGSRDGAKFIGGLGPCGRKMCCVNHIEEFDNVSIKMAKNQNLSLNPQKISGTCGKLLCCIKYENDDYQSVRDFLPDVNDMVKTPNGDAKVLSVDILQKKVKVKFNDDTIGFFTSDEIKFTRKKTDFEIDDSLKGLE